MADTQYIGARYVPKIYDNPDDNTNNWKQGVEYEPLTMVSYAGGAYTSKVPVPASADNPADARQYWAYMGSSSGQITTNTNNISRIQHAIANATEAGNICTSARAINDYVWIDGTLYRCTAAIAVNDAYVEGINITPITDMATALNAIQAISADITDIQGDILTIEDSITTLDGKITDLETELSDPYTLCIGDSYAAGYDPAGNNDGWPTYLMNLGVRGQSIYAGGSGFHLPTSDTRSPMYLIQNATLQVEDSEVGRIIICEGYNDMGYNSSTIRTNLIAFINYCHTRFVNAKIYVGMCGYGWTHNENDITGNKIEIAARDYLLSCNETIAVFMPQVVGVLLGCNGLSTADHKHPNATGNRNIAQAIWAALHGLSYSTNTYYTLSLSRSAIGATGTIGISVTVQDGIVNTYQSISGNITIDSANAIDVHAVDIDDSTPVPCLPLMQMLVSPTIHNMDTANGLGKAYYGILTYLLLGYTASVYTRTLLINDAGNNYGMSKKYSLSSDNASFNSCGSFI